jgi:hypothetical protein
LEAVQVLLAGSEQLKLIAILIAITALLIADTGSNQD